MNKVQVKIITQDDDAYIPLYATSDAAGADLKAKLSKKIYLKPNKIVLVPTGIFLEIPKNFEMQIRPRSGLALKYGITVLNSPGTIDADYRGEVKVLLINHSKEVFTVYPKMKIAQLVLVPIYQAEFVKSKKLAISLRQEGGFGHTGVY